MLVIILSLSCIAISVAITVLFGQKKFYKEGYESRSLEISNLKSKVESIQKELSFCREQIVKHTSTEQQLQLKNAQLTAELDCQKKLSEETKLALSSTKQYLQDHMTLVAQSVMKESRQELSSANEKNIVGYINPLQQKITALEQYISEAYHKENKQRYALQQEINRLFEATISVSKDAQNLATALKGNNKVQGNWGEMILENILTSSGLRKSYEYKTQVSLKNEENEYLRPDTIVYLPDNKHIVIDSKVSLISYQKSLEDEDNSSHFINQHVQCIKQHIKNLSQKHYDKLKEVETLSFVILLIPIEPAFIAALTKEPSLLENASQKRIALASPSTLIPILKTVSLLWKHEQQNKNALEIAQHGAQLYDKCVNFIESVDEMEQKIQSLSKCHETMMNRLYRGRGNLISHIEKMKNMGIEPRKSMNQNHINRAHEDCIDVASINEKTT